jgi:hypothetical protein
LKELGIAIEHLVQMSIAVSHIKFPFHPDLDNIGIWWLSSGRQAAFLPAGGGFRLELLRAAPHFVVKFSTESRIKGISVEKQVFAGTEPHAQSLATVVHWRRNDLRRNCFDRMCVITSLTILETSSSKQDFRLSKSVASGRRVAGRCSTTNGRKWIRMYTNRQRHVHTSDSS